jgi:hypothetical protein
MGAFGRQFVLVLSIAAAALAASVSIASAGELPSGWDPRTVALNHQDGNEFLLRPGQIIAGPGDGPDVQRILTDWRQDDQHPLGLTLFKRAPQTTDPAREVLAALARVRKATASRPQGPAQVAPNYVYVGSSAAVTLTGEPRIQGGPGASVRLATPPAALPQRTTNPADGSGVKIAVLDTGMLDHQWLTSVQRAANSDDTWDADHDGYADAEAGHGTFVAGLIRQVAPAASVYAVKVLNSQGVGDDWGVGIAMATLPADVDIVNLSLGGYTDHNTQPLAIATALLFLGKQRTVVAAAGNDAGTRQFWPAAFKRVLGVGAVEQNAGAWTRASYSNLGPWVDAAARGSNLQSTFATDQTKVAQGLTPAVTDPTIAFSGWAEWDGTSFATPIAAAMIARTMSRAGLGSAVDAQSRLLQNSPPAPQPDFPNAVLLDELQGMGSGSAG